MIVLISALGFSASGQGSGEARSRLPCLAPLIWRWESGEFPLTLGEAFFRGPYHFREFEEVPDEVAIPFPVADLKEMPEAQRFFDKGVALIHGFRDLEAERAFRQVTVSAPDCAMAYWGLALANGQSPGRAWLFAAEAKKRLGPNASENERMWIEWVGHFFEEPEKDEIERRRRAVRDLEALVREFPDDLHARAFLVRQVVLNEHRAGMEIGSRLAIDRMIDEILDEEPSYPARDYRIFLWLNDRPEFANVVIDPFAKRPARSMFTAENLIFLAELNLAQGMADRALNAFEWAVVAERLWLSEGGMMPEESAVLPELVGRWTAMLGGMGQVADAELAANAAANLRRNPHFRRNLGRNEAIADVRAEAQRALLQSWIDWGLWDRVIEYGIPQPVVTDTYANTVWAFDRFAALAVAEFLYTGKREGFERRISQLEKLRDNLQATMREYEAARRFAEETLAELEHFMKFCEGGEASENGYRFAGKGRLARICAEKGRMEAALELAEANREERPGVFEATATAIAMRYRAGKVKEAVFLMDREFRRLAGRADADLPIRDELNEVADALKLPEDWTLPTDEQTIRNVSAESLLEWELPEAAAWTLPNWKGEEVSLANFSGKPVLLVFFLGGGCLHCVQQLTALVPRAPEYKAAGIPIVAISTDGAEILGETLGKEVDPEKAFPFEIVSDRNLKVFKAYEVFDQFEERALHGTFLLDGESRVVWRELSHEPFLKPDFLLNEARRLLRP